MSDNENSIYKAHYLELRAIAGRLHEMLKGSCPEAELIREYERYANENKEHFTEYESLIQKLSKAITALEIISKERKYFGALPATARMTLEDIKCEK